MKDKKKTLVASSYFPGHSYADFVRPLGGEIVYEESKFLANPNDFDLVVFTGGEDITPTLYGETSPRGICSFNMHRDALEKKVFDVADYNRIRMYGICRGTQFINVMLGGKMMHHITGHGGSNHEITLTTNNIVPPNTLVNSLHHQMCIPTLHTYILAWSTQRKSVRYIGDKDEDMVYTGPEVEAIFNPSFRSLGVQWHPEIMTKTDQGTVMSFQMLKDFMEFEMGGFMKKYLPSAAKSHVVIKRGNEKGPSHD